MKREHSKKFVTEEAFNIVTKKLQDIPNNFSRKVNEISQDIFNSAITKDEFSSFKLMMARDVCHLKVSAFFLDAIASLDFILSKHKIAALDTKNVFF